MPPPRPSSVALFGTTTQPAGSPEIERRDGRPPRLRRIVLWRCGRPNKASAVCYQRHLDTEVGLGSKPNQYRRILLRPGLAASATPASESPKRSAIRRIGAYALSLI